MRHVPDHAHDLERLLEAVVDALADDVQAPEHAQRERLVNDDDRRVMRVILPRKPAAPQQRNLHRSEVGGTDR